MDRGDLQAAGGQVEVLLDYLLPRTLDSLHLLDDRFDAILSPDEKALKQSLRALAAVIPWAGSCASPVWLRVQELLARLGLSRPPR